MDIGTFSKVNTLLKLSKPAGDEITHGLKDLGKDMVDGLKAIHDVGQLKGAGKMAMGIGISFIAWAKIRQYLFTKRLREFDEAFEAGMAVEKYEAERASCAETVTEATPEVPKRSLQEIIDERWQNKRHDSEEEA